VHNEQLQIRQGAVVHIASREILQTRVITIAA